MVQNLFTLGRRTLRGTYAVKHMLMRRSQLHPVMKAAAAGGNRMATYGAAMRLLISSTHQNEIMIRTMMRRTSEPRTGMMCY